MLLIHFLEANIKMALIWCFNCKKWADHISKNCDKEQLFSRCPTCELVCDDDSKHHVLCDNKAFRSSYLLRKSVVTTTIRLQLSFNGIRNVWVCDGNRGDKKVTTEPLFLANENAFVYKNGRNLVYSKINVDRNDQPTKISLVDTENNPLVLAEYVGNMLFVNDRYRIEKNIVSINAIVESRAQTTANVAFKIDKAGDTFSTFFHVDGLRHHFDVYATGVVYIDALFNVQQRKIEGSNGKQNPIYSWKFLYA